LPGFFLSEEGEAFSLDQAEFQGELMNIYVGNLPWELSEDELREAFAAFGAVESARIITDRMTGRSRGFGFVEMPNNEEAKAAIADMNGKSLKGRNIKVNEARTRDDSRGGGGRGGGGFGHRW
jgi:RNA recognition motif-containing protein